MNNAPESLFWYWVIERHRIYLRRQAGQSKPWTDDPILRDYKFTNPFREHDRGTVWLREHFLEPHRDDDLSLIAFNICWYRMFNWWGTGEAIGWRTSWNPNAMKAILITDAARGRQIFTGAHIVYSPPGRPKIDAIVDVCSELYALRHQIVEAAEKQSLAHVFDLLTTVHCVGGFLAYEMVSDMRHTRLLEHASDIMTWANMGPGAKRGLQRLGLECYNQERGCASMQELLQHGRHAPYLHEQYIRPEAWPRLEMRDIEHSLCEFDKYCRVKFGEGFPRSKYPGGR